MLLVKKTVCLLCLSALWPAQVHLEPFLDCGETVSIPDGGGELIPPLGGQTGEELVLEPGALERWDHQTVVKKKTVGGTFNVQSGNAINNSNGKAVVKL